LIGLVDKYHNFLTKNGEEKEFINITKELKELFRVRIFQQISTKMSHQLTIEFIKAFKNIWNTINKEGKITTDAKDEKLVEAIKFANSFGNNKSQISPDGQKKLEFWESVTVFYAFRHLTLQFVSAKLTIPDNTKNPSNKKNKLIKDKPEFTKFRFSENGGAFF